MNLANFLLCVRSMRKFSLRDTLPGSAKMHCCQDRKNFGSRLPRYQVRVCDHPVVVSTKPFNRANFTRSHRVGGVFHHERLRAETDDVIAYHLLDGEVVSGIPDHDRPALLPIHDLTDTDERVFQPRVLREGETAPRESKRADTSRIITLHQQSRKQESTCYASPLPLSRAKRRLTKYAKRRLTNRPIVICMPLPADSSSFTLDALVLLHMCPQTPRAMLIKLTKKLRVCTRSNIFLRAPLTV